jgi:glycosyltransferase involved in cell wall biosynthesis
MDISIVIPLYNEEESLPELCSWIQKVMITNGFSYEIILVDDGSSDNSWKVVKSLQLENEYIRGLKFRRNYGKSAALNKGFEKARGNVVITMDADLQDSPDEIPELYQMIVSGGFDLVSGWKKKRYDSKLTKNLPSKIYNATTRRLSGVKLHDMNCGLKAYKREVVKAIEVYGEMHRYIPVIAKWAGFKKIGEKVVVHRKRQYGVTKFGWERFINGFLDLVSIMFVSRFSRKPMHLFGSLGTILFVTGFLIAGYLAYAKIFLATYKMTDRPLFYFGLLAMVLGTQFFLAGFLGELIGRSSSDRNHYLVEEDI